MSFRRNDPSQSDGEHSTADVAARADGFIPGVRARLERGEFAGLGPVTFRDGGTLPDAAIALRIMLADWQHFDDLPAEQRDDVLMVARRRGVLHDLRELVATLDARRGRTPS